MILGRITPELMASVPAEVREALGLEVDRVVAYEIEGTKVIITRTSLIIDENGDPDMFVNNFSTFTEWSDEHDAAYDVLATR